MKSVFLSLCLLASFLTTAQKIVLPAEVKSTIEKRIEYGLNSSIVVGILNENGTAYFNFGTRNSIGSKPDEHSIYEIGSISKIFTATLLADKVIRGEMNVNDPVQNYLPSSVHIPTYEGKEITLGNLSDHTSSLPRMPDNFSPADPMNPYADYTIEKLYEFLSSYKINRPIGSEYEYSNLAVGLLGHLLALKAGMSYEELMLTKIAQPLHLAETKITLDDHMANNLAVGHSHGIEVKNWDLSVLAGAGAIRSSTHDLLLFLATNMGITKGPLASAMQLAQTSRHDKAGDVEVGLGWHISPGDNGKIFWHNGATGGYMAFMGFNKETHQAVVVLTNSDQPIDDIGFHLLSPSSSLQIIKPPLAGRLKELIDEQGPSSLMKTYQKLKKSNAKAYDINESDINSLGYWYMSNKNYAAAHALFEINVLEFPMSSNVYDSYGEALMMEGNSSEAIASYKKSLELNPENTNAIDMLARMGEQVEMKTITVPENILATYDGTYALSPDFNIIITHIGTQLFGQATGQSQFELFPRSTTQFYLKVVEASVEFEKDDEGQMSLILFQGGMELHGKKTGSGE